MLSPAICVRGTWKERFGSDPRKWFKVNVSALHSYKCASDSADWEQYVKWLQATFQSDHTNIIFVSKPSFSEGQKRQHWQVFNAWWNTLLKGSRNLVGSEQKCDVFFQNLSRKVWRCQTFWSWASGLKFYGFIIVHTCLQEFCKLQLTLSEHEVARKPHSFNKCAHLFLKQSRNCLLTFSTYKSYV